MSAVDVLAVMEETHANAKHSPLWCPAYEQDAAEARAAVAELMVKGQIVRETRDAYRNAGSGKHSRRMEAHTLAVDEFCAALARCKGES